MTIAWTDWGTHKPEPPARMLALLRDEVGDTTPSPAASITEARLPASTLTADAVARFVNVVGAEHVRTDDDSRARHAGGQAYADIMRRRAGDASAAPDAVICPGDAAQVAEVLRVCT